MVGWECLSPKANIPPWMKNTTARGCGWLVVVLAVVVVGVKILMGIWKLSFSMELGMEVSVTFMLSGGGGCCLLLVVALLFSV